MIRAVLDTNQYVSMAIKAGGTADRLLAAWREDRFVLLLSPPILEEIIRVLRSPRLRRLIRLTAVEINALIGIEKLCVLVPAPHTHLLRDHDLLAPHAAGRSPIVPRSPEEAPRSGVRPSTPEGSEGAVKDPTKGVRLPLLP